MSLSDLASLGSFVSGVAVLASLAFLYFQMRQMNAQVLQTERNQRALLQQGRAARSASIVLQVASSPALADAVHRAASGDPETTKTEFFQFWFYAVALIQSWEDTYFLHSRGMLDDESFQSTVGQMRRQLSFDGHQAVWSLQRGMRTDEFGAFVDRLVDEAAGTPGQDTFELWKAALARQSGRASAPV
jgi:hypothetical protein